MLEQYHWHMVMKPSVLTPQQEKEKAAKPGANFKECANGCPVMIVVPAGKFMMGSPEGEGDDELYPQHEVMIPNPFAVSKFEVTFAEWDACVAAGACPKASDSGWGRGDRPAINVSWVDAKEYVAWLSKLTGQPYRLLSEAEWEYAARADTTTRYSFGDDDTQLGDYAWYSQNSDRRTQPVGRKKQNAFGLYDMHGNVWEWVEDCWHDSHQGAPGDGSAWIGGGDCRNRVLRGGSWSHAPDYLRSAHRYWFDSLFRINYLGFRIGRSISP